MTVLFEAIITNHIENLDLENPCFDTVEFELYGKNTNTADSRQQLGQLRAKAIKASDAINFSRALLDEFLEFDGSNLANICEAAQFNSLFESGADIVIIEHLVVAPELRRMGVGSKLLEHAISHFKKRMESPYIAISSAPLSDERRNTFPMEFASFNAKPLEKDVAGFNELQKENELFLLANSFTPKSSNVFDRLITKGETL